MTNWLNGCLFGRPKIKRGMTLIEHLNHGKLIYSVGSIHNSTKYQTDQEFTQRQVNRFIRKGWTIRIVPEARRPENV